MATPYVGEIRALGFTFAPLNWAFCNGQLIDISQNPTLFQLIGTTYGGNGTTNYALPNLFGRVPMHMGTSSQMTTVLGQPLGTNQVTLSQGQMPAHIHTITAGQPASGDVVNRTAAPNPNSYLAQTNNDGVYNTASPSLNATASSSTIGLAGGSQPHENMQPYQAISFCIALYGIYPSQN